MSRTLLRLTIACVLVVVGWGSSASAWDTTAGNDTNFGSITFGGTEPDYSTSVAVDGSGNVHVAGYFDNTVNFGAGNVTSNGGEEVFVTKYDAAGAHQWTTTFGGTGADQAQSVVVDGSGNVYVGGHFRNKDAPSGHHAAITKFSVTMCFTPPPEPPAVPPLPPWS